jgi:preprotein translocase subunit Sec61beta
VRYLGRLWRRSLHGAGRIRFSDKHLTLRGSLKPGILVQVALAVVGALLVLLAGHMLNIPLMLGSALSILPVLLVYFAARKAMTCDIPYSSISYLSVKGCHVEFRCVGKVPQRVRLYVSGVDGERLYHELQPRFPAALVGWAI